MLSGFAEASDLTLPKLAGLNLGESTVGRATEAAGRDVGECLARGEVFGPARDWAWHKDAQGKTCASVSLDATDVRFQCERGAEAEGKMVSVAMVPNLVPEAHDRRARPDGPAPRFDVRYLTAADGMTGLGEPLRRQARRVGMDRA